MIGRVVANGFGPGLPAVVIDDDIQLVAALAELLDDPVEQDRLGAASRAHIAAHYSVARWVPWATAILEQARRS